MSEDNEQMDAAAEARLKRKNKALGLTLFGLVLLIGIVSFFKIDIATP